MNPQAIEITAARYCEEIGTKLYERCPAQSSNRTFLLTHVGIYMAQDALVSDKITMENARKWIKFLSKIDPSPKSIYTKWLLRMWLTDKAFNPLFEDLATSVVQTIQLFDNAKPRLDQGCRNIDAFKTFQDFETFVFSIPIDLIKSKRQEDRDLGVALVEKGEAEIFLDSNDIRIVIPKTVEAAKYFGRSTRWCTAADNFNAFASYHRQGPLYIILFKKDNVRWQFHFESKQMMDEQDRSLSFEVIGNSPVHQYFEWERIVSKSVYFLPLLKTKPTPEIRRLALMKNVEADRYIKRLTPTERELHVRHFPRAVLREQYNTPKLRSIALGCNPELIGVIKSPTREEMLQAIDGHFNALRHFRKEDITEEIATYALSKYSYHHYRGYHPAHAYSSYEEYKESIRYGYGGPRDQKSPEPLEPIYYIPADVLTPLMLRNFYIQGGKVDMTKFKVKTEKELSVIYRKVMEDFDYLMTYAAPGRSSYEKGRMAHVRLQRQMEEAIKALKKVPNYDYKYDASLFASIQNRITLDNGIEFLMPEI